jgi:hypothetical protein
MGDSPTDEEILGAIAAGVLGEELDVDAAQPEEE